MRPLDGLLVVALEQAVAAPYASERLAEAGARVIKLERAEGDFARKYDRFAEGSSSYFVWLNGGKESCVVDLRAEDDLAMVREMLKGADIFIQNLGARRGHSPGSWSRGASRSQSAPHHLRDIGLWRVRTHGRAQGLRPSRPGRKRAFLDHRNGARAGPGRRLGLRHRHRDACLRGDPRGADRARAGRARGRISRSRSSIR